MPTDVCGFEKYTVKIYEAKIIILNESCGFLMPIWDLENIRKFTFILIYNAYRYLNFSPALPMTCHINSIEGTGTELQNVFDKTLDSVFNRLVKDSHGSTLPTSGKWYAISVLFTTGSKEAWLHPEVKRALPILWAFKYHEPVDDKPNFLCWLRNAIHCSQLLSVSSSNPELHISYSDILVWCPMTFSADLFVFQS